MLSLTATTVFVHGLSVLRNMAFMTLSCGALCASVYFSLKGRETALSWFLWATLASVTLFAVSLSHLKHQMLELTPPPQSSSSSGATNTRTVQESGDAAMKACLVAAGVYIVLQGWRLLVLFSTTRVPDSPLIIVRFFVGALLCVGVLGVGLSVHLPPGGVPKSRPWNVK
jgi:hypothetical protein